MLDGGPDLTGSWLWLRGLFCAHVFQISPAVEGEVGTDPLGFFFIWPYRDLWPLSCHVVLATRGCGRELKSWGLKEAGLLARDWKIGKHWRKEERKYRAILSCWQRLLNEGKSGRRRAEFSWRPGCVLWLPELVFLNEEGRPRWFLQSTSSLALSLTSITERMYWCSF